MIPFEIKNYPYSIGDLNYKDAFLRQRELYKKSYTVDLDEKETGEFYALTDFLVDMDESWLSRRRYKRTKKRGPLKITMYVAYDGTLFEDFLDCQKYEQQGRKFTRR